MIELKCGNVDLIDIYQQNAVLLWCILLFLLFDMAVSDLNVLIFAGQPAGQEPLIFTGQLGGLTDRLLIGSGHENLDWFHLMYMLHGPANGVSCF